MYFIDNEHEENFVYLSSQYPEYLRENVEYKPTIYIAAFPEVYKFLDSEEINGGSSALQQLIEFDSKGKLEIKEPGLTSGAKGLVRLATNLFNGRDFDLADAIDMNQTEGWSKTLLQAIKIRMKLK